MGLFYQSDMGLDADIRSIGCEYLCCLAAAVDYLDLSISVKEVNDIWDCGIQGKWLHSKLGLHTQTSYRRLFEHFGLSIGDKEFVGDQVGSILNGRLVFWDWWNSNEFTHVIRRVYSTYQNKHSILLNRDFEKIFDPAPWFGGDCADALYLFYLGNKDSFDYRELGNPNVK